MGALTFNILIQQIIFLLCRNLMQMLFAVYFKEQQFYQDFEVTICLFLYSYDYFGVITTCYTHQQKFVWWNQNIFGQLFIALNILANNQLL